MYQYVQFEKKKKKPRAKFIIVQSNLTINKWNPYFISIKLY